MNIKYHAAIGVVLDFALGTHGLMTFASVIPDAPLIVNEIRMIIHKETFDPLKVQPWVAKGYFISHSLWFCWLIIFISPPAFFAYLIHILTDWFTHTGVFASKPMYPFLNWQIDFGRDVLK